MSLTYCLYIQATVTTDLDWNAVTFAQRSSSGKVGVYFLQFPGSRVLVVKLTDCPASELAGGEVARLMGVSTPALGVLSTAHGEGAAMVAMLRNLRRAGRYEGKWNSPSRFGWILLQEFQAGRTLNELAHEEVARTPDSPWPTEIFGAAGKPSARGAATLRALGRMVACDVLTHNSDRFFLPQIFSNFSRCGNVANLIFDDDSDEPVAIDNACSAFTLDRADNAARFHRYCTSVSELTARVIRRLRDADASGSSQVAPHPALKSVCDFFVSGQGKAGDASYVPGLEHDLGEVGLFELERGFLSVVERIQSWDCVESVFEGVNGSVRTVLGLSEESTACDLCRLTPSFFTAIATAMIAADADALTERDTEPDATGPAARWYLKRPALGVCKPFCRIGDRLAVRMPVHADSEEMCWCIGVVTAWDGLAERASARVALPDAAPVEWAFGLDDLQLVRWELRTEAGGGDLEYGAAGAAAPPPVMMAPAEAPMIVGGSSPPPPVAAPADLEGSEGAWAVRRRCRGVASRGPQQGSKDLRTCSGFG